MTTYKTTRRPKIMTKTRRELVVTALRCAADLCNGPEWDIAIADAEHSVGVDLFDYGAHKNLVVLTINKDFRSWGNNPALKRAALLEAALLIEEGA